MLATVVAAVTVAAAAGTTEPVAASADTSTEPTVRLVVTHDRSTTTDEVVDAVADLIDVAGSGSLPELATTTVDVPTSQVGAALADLRRADGVDAVRVDGRATASGITPNDPYWSSQSSLRTIGLPDAWTRSTGAASAVVAVVDTGVEPTSDLGGRLLAGHDFVNGDNDPNDDNGHGSDVATIIASGGNDGLSIAGVCWACRIMPVKVLDGAGSGYMSDVASGIVWATNQGATIINLSLGSPSSDAAVSNAVAYALAHDVVVVAAAGNDGSTNRSYPGADAGVVSVAASDPSGNLYSWSQRGSSWVDVAAPGCNIADGGNLAGTFCGTSSATPVVAGTVGLLRSLDQTASRTTIVNTLLTTATPLATAGQVAYGRIDAAAAAAATPSVPAASSGPGGGAVTPPDSTGPSLAIQGQGIVTGMVTTRIDTWDPSGVAAVTLWSGQTALGSAVPGPDGVAVVQWDSSPWGDGTVALAADGVDGYGNHASAEGSVVVDNVDPQSTIYGPINGKTVTGPFTLGVAASDGNDAQVTIVVANSKWASAFAGNGSRTVTMNPTANGTYQMIALTLDRAGHRTFSRVISVKVKLKHPPARRR